MKVISLLILLLLTIACEKQAVVHSLLKAQSKNESIDQAYCSLAERADGTLMSCPDGKIHYLITAENEHECSAFQLPQGVLFRCENGETALIESSFDDRLTIHETLDPCGAQSLNDEVLLISEDERVFSFLEGEVVSSLKERFEGSYQTEDGTHCQYEIDQNKNITW